MLIYGASQQRGTHRLLLPEAIFYLLKGDYKCMIVGRAQAARMEMVLWLETDPSQDWHAVYRPMGG